MAPRIFVTGITGYIGGHFVDRLTQVHPEYHVVGLVRSEAQGKQVNNQYPKLETVLGDLDSHDVLVKEGSEADVILQLASSDHVSAVKSLIEGASKRPGDPAYFIHIGGTGVLSETPSGIGKPSSRFYSDIRDIDEITSFDYSHLHREIDDAVLTAGSKFSVPTAILCPPIILGVGHGPVKKRSIQVPVYIDAVMKRGKAFTLGDGQNIWDYVHVSDVADALIKLTEEALKPHGGDADWGKKGYYFCEAGEYKWGDLHKKIAEILYAKGAIKSADVEEMTAEEASEIHPWGPILWGGNARSRAERLRNLSWTPKEMDVHKSLAEMADFEIESARKAA